MTDLMTKITEIFGNEYKYVQNSDGSVSIMENTSSSYPRFQVRIPANYTSNLQSIYYFPGYNNGSTDAGTKEQANYINSLFTQNSNSVVATTCSCYDKYDLNSWIAPIYEKLGLKIDQSVSIGFSDGGNGAGKSLSNQITSGKDTDNILLLYDAHHVGNIGDEALQTLIDNDTTVVLVNNGGSDDILKRSDRHGLQKLIDNGVTVIQVTASGSADGHAALNNAALANNIAGYVLGNQDLPANSDLYIKYSVYDPETKTMKEITAAEAQELMGGTKDPAKLYEKYTNLSDFAKKNKSDSTTLASNLCFVYNSMESIDGIIGDQVNTINAYTAETGEAGIISSMYNANNYMLNISNGVLGKLGEESSAIKTIAQGIYAMDEFASHIAESTLDDGTKSKLFGSSSTLSSLNETLSSGIKSLLTENEYSKNRDLYTTNVEVGKVGKISVSGINSALNSVIPSLQGEMSEAAAMKSAIASFSQGIGSSNILQGELWNNVLANMNTYDDLMDLRSSSSEFLIEAVKFANKIILDYMDPDTELDDSKLPELKNTLAEVEKKISDLTETISTMEANPYSCTSYEQEDGTITQSCSGYKTEDIAPYKNQLELAEQQKKELDEDIKKLEGLPEVINKAQQVINDALSQIDSEYGRAAECVQNNQEFTANFKLDVSGYGYTDEQYNTMMSEMNSYYGVLEQNRLAEEAAAKAAAEAAALAAQNGTAQQTAGSTGGGSGSGGGTGGSGGSGSGGGGSSSDSDSDKKEETKEEEKQEEDSKEETKEEDSKEETKEESQEETKYEEEQKEEEKEEQPKDEETKVEEKETTETKPGTEKKKTSKKSTNYSSSSSNNTKKNVNTKEEPTIDTTNSLDSEITEPITQEPEITEPIVTEPEEYIEPIIEEPEIVIEDVTPDEVQTNQTSNKGLKTLGIATGIGLAVGASALGAHTLMKNKSESEEEADYGYEK